MNELLAQIYHQPWLMEPGALRLLAQRLEPLVVGENLSKLAVAYQLPLSVANRVATIPVSGVLLKTVPGWVRFYGIDATGYDEIRSMLQMALVDDRAGRIELRISSPGGMVAGGMEAAEAIRAADQVKPVTAVIEDLGASGAYWLAASARRIEANANAEVGSIGVYTVYMDWSGLEAKWGIKTIVIRSGEHKGMGLDAITENQIAAVQEDIDGIAAHFVAHVAAGRKMAPEQAKGLATGRVWLAPKALELGLIDAVTSAIPTPAAPTNPRNEAAAEADINNQNSNAGDQAMGETQITVTAEAAMAAEKKRTSDIKAAFPKDAAFTLEAIEAGWSVTEAKAVRCDRLEAVAAARVPGDPGVPFGESETAAPTNFVEVARARAVSDGISRKEAMRCVARERPKLYEAFLASEARRPVLTNPGKK